MADALAASVFLITFASTEPAWGCPHLSLSEEALEMLCRTYWRPLYGFLRRHGLGREEAQDLIQEFFARLLEHRNLDTVRREKGRLRSYLLVSLKHFLASERHRASGVKRCAYPLGRTARVGSRRF